MEEIPMARKSRKKEQIEDNLIKTAIYIRLSNEEKEEDTSNKIENQYDVIDRFIKLNPNLIHVKTYIDNGKTGTNFERPEWQRLIQDVKVGAVECIVVKDLSRLGRSYRELDDYLSNELSGTRIIAINDSFDTLLNNKDDIIYPLKNIINTAYSKDLSKKIKSARKIQRLKGEFTGNRVPYGYKKSDGRFVIDNNVSEVVKEIFYKIEEGVSYSAIAMELNQKEIKSPLNYSSGRQNLWSYQTVKSISSNEMYLGHMVQKDICINNTHAAIVSDELFQKVQDMKQSIRKKYMKQKKNDKFVFDGIIYDVYSGKKMYKTTYKRQDGIIRCYKSAKRLDASGKAFPIVQIREELLIDCLINILKRYISVFTDIKENVLFKEVDKQISREIRILNEHVAKIVIEKEKIEEKIMTAYQDCIRDIINKDVFMKLKNIFSMDIDKLDKEIKQCNEKLKELKAVSTFQLNIQDFDIHLVKKLVDKILVYSSTEIEIVFKFQNEFKQFESYYTM